jgi:hypothetical protein
MSEIAKVDESAEGDAGPEEEVLDVVTLAIADETPPQEVWIS